MTGPTRTLHYAIIRALKGVLTAWEEWLKAQS
jgi:hypothetical protein